VWSLLYAAELALVHLTLADRDGPPGGLTGR
jgi:hypothetical protein